MKYSQALIGDEYESSNILHSFIYSQKELGKISDNINLNHTI